jgi:hypothetical protein
VRRLALTALILIAGAANAQPTPAAPPDPMAWWTDKAPPPPEAAAPLGGRRLARGERPIPVDNGVDPSTYRLWGLPPLQWQLLRGDEMVLELWVRPSLTVRQSVVRIVVRHDGRAFVQARAGLACCEPEISRRIGFDAELPAGSARTFLALRSHPMWSAPRAVQVNEGAGMVDALCMDGTSYDLTLMIPGWSRSIRRACDYAEIGQVADALEAVLRAALGHDPRFDVLFAGRADFSAARGAYDALLKGGGTLKPDPNARPQPVGVEPVPGPDGAPR